MTATDRRLVSIVLTLCVALPSAACDGGSGAGADAGPSDAGRVEEPDAWVPPIERPPFAADNALDPGDPRYEGQQRFLFDTWGTEVLGEWPPADFMLALMRDEPDLFGDQYEAFGFVPNPDGEFPIGLERGIDDPTLVHETCAVCHVGELPDGRLWIGAPNGRLDWGRFRAEINDRWIAAGNPPLMSVLQAAKARALGPGRTNAETSDYPQVVPADFPPYFDLGERSHLNYLGTGGDARTESYIGLYAFGVGAPNPREAIVPFPPSARVDPLIAFVEGIAPPVGPAQDAAQVSAGRAVFERERCGECHHVDDLSMDGVTPYDRAPDGRDRFPGDDPAFPDGSIHTSYWHRILIDGDPDAGAGGGGADDRTDLIRFIVAHGLRVGISDGYRVQSLRGLWATAPYLHNGSVPTLEDLLRPAAERPTTFMRGDFLVDTTLAGNGNGGHELGVALSEPDRSALAAYLRSL